MEMMDSLEINVNSSIPEPTTIHMKNSPGVVTDNTNNREWILEAIDKLRERKARPDAEKIGILLKRYHNISAEETLNSLNRLADSGQVVCVDYKGNVSYRNPTKWRKTSSGGGGVLNTPSISQQIIKVVRALRDEVRATNPIPDSNCMESGSDAMIQEPVPQQAFNFSDIEKAFSLEAANCLENGDGLCGKASLDFNGIGLRTIIDRECTYGGLIKLLDGRYAIDESGVKKKPPPTKKTKQPSSIAKAGSLPKTNPQKPPPPPPLQASVVLPPDVIPICQQPQTPHQVQTVFPQLHPSVTNVMEQTPVDYGTALPLITSITSPFSSSSFPPSSKTSGSGGSGKPSNGSGRRGRPPGSKNKKCTTPGEQPPKKKGKSDVSFDSSNQLMKSEGISASQDSSQDPDYSNSASGVCVKCGSQAVDIEDFLTCKDCSMKAHPSCLGYWAELTERARRSPWQCSDCKTCCICQDPGAPEQMLICDACDKGFHAGCHQPPVTYPMDESTAWLCHHCRLEGHRVASSDTAGGDSAASRPPVAAAVFHHQHHQHQGHQLSPSQLAAGGGGGLYYQSQQQPAAAAVTERFPPARQMNGEADGQGVGNQPSTGVGGPPHHEAPTSTTNGSNSGAGGTNTTTADIPLKVEESSDPRSWSVDDVALWLTTEGFQREARAFREQEIDGPCLLLMKRMDVLTELGIKLGPAVKIYERIKRLQNRGTWSYGEVY